MKDEYKKMKGKIIYSIILGIFLIGIISAATYCCERTTSGAWCQSVSVKTQCNAAFQTTAAYCEATSYCKTGTCINQKEGTCTSSTQSACTTNGGFWSQEKATDLAQCKLGCCLMADQAAFVTQTNCNRLSSLYGLKVNFQSAINDELTCLASANPEAKGACVYTKNYVKTCEATTKKDCQDKAKISSYENTSFHEGYLCSAQELGTVCAKSKQTQCSGDDVYFVDTCGNLANIYDASKLEDENYWTKIQAPTCGNKAGNKDSPSCGDCDYYSGSMCKAKKTGDVVSSGNYMCKNLDCTTYRGLYSGSGSGYATASRYPKHGETWCATETKNGAGIYSPGATSFRMICYNGEVTNEECDSTRQKVCAENITDVATGFRTANCKVNEWSDCWSQTTETDCGDVNVRDCSWNSLNGYSFSSGNGLIKSDSSGVCVPKYSPGFTRDGDEKANVVASCGLASSICVVKMEKHIGGSWRCDHGFFGNKGGDNNCSCVEDSAGRYDGGKTWASKISTVCSQMGDCGQKVNYIGSQGYQNESLIITTLS
jgi:hypothetical protein